MSLNVPKAMNLRLLDTTSQSDVIGALLVIRRFKDIHLKQLSDS
jgi:hypothetical protein